MEHDIEALIERAARAIKSAEALLITAGAGMGVDSGLPDFRGTQGFWRAYPVIARLGLSFEEMANPAWFEREPQLAWAFYGHRLNLYRDTKPHAGFQQLLEACVSKAAGYFVFTSNVDGHFQKAGFPPDQILECHGSIHHLQCARPCHEEIWDIGDEKVTVDESRFRAVGHLPCCKKCSGLARPNILMFGDWCWLNHRAEIQEQRFSKWLAGVEHAGVKLAIIELGAGTAIPTVRHTSERVCSRSGGTLVRINPREFSVPAGQMGLALGAASGLGRVLGP